MTFDEALSEACAGARVTQPEFAPGVYVEHSFSRGFLKCWPVDRVEDEPQRTQCDFRATDSDRAAEWSIVERVPVPLPAAPAKPKIVAGWGAPLKPPCPRAITIIETKVEFCGECDFEKSACKCPKPEVGKWGTPKKEPGKWGI